MALDVSDDSKVLNIDMVHANIMQVDITMKDERGGVCEVEMDQIQRLARC